MPDDPVSAAPLSPVVVPVKSAHTRRSVDTQKYVATFVLVVFLGVTVLICWHTVPPENKDALEILIGVVAGSYKDIIQFFFGSTSASHQKDDAIAALAANPSPPNS